MDKFIEFARSLIALAKDDARFALLIVENQIEHQQESLQLALSHVQQSVEKASKALLLLTENPKYNMPYFKQKLSHNSLHVRAACGRFVCDERVDLPACSKFSLPDRTGRRPALRPIAWRHCQYREVG